MKRTGAVLVLVAACGGTQELPAPAFPAQTAEPVPVALGARRHPDEAPNANENRDAVVRQPRQATPPCACARK